MIDRNVLHGIDVNSAASLVVDRLTTKADMTE